MEMPKNKFKKMANPQAPLVGLWNALVDNIAGEIIAGTGFDWVVIDAEHAPFDLRSILHQLQVMERFDVPIIVRPPSGDPVFIKQLLDIGVQTLLIPMVESAENAEQIFRAMQYPPRGVRGIGTAMARAAQWNKVEDYFKEANNEMCLIVQVETKKGIEQLDEILMTEGIDGVFIGPADLSASMGFIGQPDHPVIKNEIKKAIIKIKNAQKVAGIMALSKELADYYIECGANMIAVGIDTLLLSNASQQLLERYKPSSNTNPGTKY